MSAGQYEPGFNQGAWGNVQPDERELARKLDSAEYAERELIGAVDSSVMEAIASAEATEEAISSAVKGGTGTVLDRAESVASFLLDLISAGVDLDIARADTSLDDVIEENGIPNKERLPSEEIPREPIPQPPQPPQPPDESACDVVPIGHPGYAGLSSQPVYTVGPAEPAGAYRSVPIGLNNPFEFVVWLSGASPPTYNSHFVGYENLPPDVTIKVTNPFQGYLLCLISGPPNEPPQPPPPDSPPPDCPPCPIPPPEDACPPKPDYCPPIGLEKYEVAERDADIFEVTRVPVNQPDRDQTFLLRATGVRTSLALLGFAWRKHLISTAGDLLDVGSGPKNLFSIAGKSGLVSLNIAGKLAAWPAITAAARRLITMAETALANLRGNKSVEELEADVAKEDELPPYEECRFGSYLGLVYLKAAATAMTNFQIGVNALLYAATKLEYDLGPLMRVLDYWINFTCPTIMPAPSETMRMFIHKKITDGEARFLWAIQGQAAKYFDPLAAIARQRPTVLDTVHMALRGDINGPTFLAKLREMGYTSDEEIGQIYKLAQYLPPPSDLIRFAVKDTFLPTKIGREEMKREYDDQVGLKEFLAAQGIGEIRIRDAGGKEWREDMGLHEWLAHYQNMAPGQAFEAQHRLREGRTQRFAAVGFVPPKWDINDTRRLLKEDDYNPVMRDILAALSYRKLGRIDIRRLLRYRKITAAEALELFKDDGFLPDDASDLVDLETHVANQRPTTAQLQRWFARGYLSDGDFIQVLRDRGYPDKWAELYLREARGMRLPAQMTLTKRQIFKAWSLGITDDESTKRLLGTLGLDDRQQNTALESIKLEWRTEHVRQAVAAVRKEYMLGASTAQDARGRLGLIGVNAGAQDRLLLKWSAELNPVRKVLSAGEVSDMMFRGLINVQEGLRRLFNLGYSAADADLLVLRTVQNQQIAAAKAALQAQRNQAARQREQERVLRTVEAEREKARTRAVKNATPERMSRWLKKGLIDEGTVRNRLDRAGWEPDNIERFLADSRNGTAKPAP